MDTEGMGCLIFVLTERKKIRLSFAIETTVLPEKLRISSTPSPFVHMSGEHAWLA